MRIAVGSAFRDCAGRQTSLFMKQVAALARACPNDYVHALAVEGDSKDDTVFDLKTQAARYGVPMTLGRCHHGGGPFGPTEDPFRMACLSLVGNAIHDLVKPDDDLLFYVESDLVWSASTARALLLQAEGTGDVVVPLVFCQGVFYDIWAFRRHGRRFDAHAPYHPDLDGERLELDSAGSCMAMRAETSRAVRIQDGGALVGWCTEARAKGFRIFVDPTLRIEHPARE